MADTIVCSRCHREVTPLPRPPLPGAFGGELQRRVCADCWAEWQRAEVMVINELRLDFMDPASQSVLDQQMRQFFALEEGEPAS